MQQVEVNPYDHFDIPEGTIEQYYGRIGNGKTYIATYDLLQDLRAGKVVYANWRVNFDGLDQRKSWFESLISLITFRDLFFHIQKKNLHFLPIDDNFFDTIAKLTDCVIYLDEGHLAFDSYQLTRMPIERRASILHTRHFDRTIKIISQRPTAIHVVLRANVNRFFKCEKVFDFFGIRFFRKTEYQDLTGDEKPDEEQEIDSELYYGWKEVFNAYDTKYLRGDTPQSQPNYAVAYILRWTERLKKSIFFWK